ncbi:MAG: zeta toxin family protein [Ostreibacterium sp.]
MTEKNFTNNELEGKFKKIWKEVAESCKKIQKPTAYVLGGLPGSGKSRLSKLIAHQKFDDNVLIIDGDTFRETHPRFNELSENGTKDCSQETQQWAGAMVQLFIDETKKNRFNAIVEGTFRTATAPTKTLNEFKAEGYQLGVAVLLTDNQTAWNATIERYDEAVLEGKSPRAVPEDHFIKVVDSIAENVEAIADTRLADTFVIYDRNSLKNEMLICDVINDRPKDLKEFVQGKIDGIDNKVIKQYKFKELHNNLKMEKATNQKKK